MLAKIHEIFTSIQGEGILSGKRHVFVRFFGCGFGCSFCDTPQEAHEMKEYTAEELLSAVSIKALPGSVHSVSITGGEPLLQADFLKIFLPRLKQTGYKVYLETNGALPDELAKIIDYVDIIAMDIKLPTSTLAKGLWQEHSQFLDIAMTKQVFVKIVVTDKTTASDFNRAVLLVAQKNPYIALVIQPVTDHASRVGPLILESFKKIAKEHILRVKVIPQMHKIYGIR